MIKMNLGSAKIRDPKTKQFNPIAGLIGESAYQTAVRLGTFSGTEKEWNDYIKTEREKALEDIRKAGEELSTYISVQTFVDVKQKTPHIDTVKNYYNLQRTGKVYQTKIWKFATNPTSVGEKLLDNAGLEFVPSTDTTEGKDDYLNGNHPMFEWVHCNYKRNDDGTAYPIATEYDNNYATTGAVDVGAMQMSFYWNWDASNPEYDLVTISDMPNEKYGLKPWTECKRADGTVLPYCIGSAYVSGIASDGLLRSQPELKPERNQSHNNMITNYQKKGKGYWGAGAERNTFQILFNIIKGATKNSQSLFQGCTNYSFQYSASIQSTDTHTYFPVTNDQAKNILVGSYVSVGYGQLNDTKNGVNNDRGVANIHKYADDVKVLRIETLDENNKAVYLDIKTGFNTTSIKLSDTVNAPITISSMYWWSGTTDTVIGRHDGSYVSNTDGKHAYRVQGREYAVGSYIVASDTVMDFQSDYSKKVYIAPKGLAHSSSDATIRSKYKYVFKRIRRLAIRLWKRIKTHQKVLESHARKMISYLGLLKNSNSVKVIQKYHVKDIMKISKKVVKEYDKISLYGKAAFC